MAKLMKAIAINNGKGSASALYINNETPMPVPKPGEALVRVRAFGLNRLDLVQREGNYPPPEGAPQTLGVEFSGTIASLGPALDSSDSSSSFNERDPVFGLAYGGAYAEYIAVSTQTLLHKPPFLTFEQAAGIPETWATAAQALHFVGCFSPGQTVLWHAGASAVSIAGVQLSRLAGAADVFATAGTSEKCAFTTRELGASRAWNYKKEDWCEGVLAATGGKGVDLIVDFVGASYFQKNLRCAARDGCVALFGVLSGTRVDGADIAPIVMKRLRVEGSTLRSRDAEYQGRLIQKLGTYLPEFETGKLKVVIDRVFPWEKVGEAHEYMESNASTGKIICTIP